jgi:hypothetical protein
MEIDELGDSLGFTDHQDPDKLFLNRGILIAECYHLVELEQRQSPCPGSQLAV